MSEALNNNFDVYGINMRMQTFENKEVLDVLVELSRQISPSHGLTLGTVTELEKAKRELDQAKRSYFQPKMIYDALNEVAEEDRNVKMAIHDLIASSEVTQFFELPSNVPGNLPLGISTEHLNLLAPEVLNKDLMNTVLPGIESKIFGKAEDLMKVYTPGSSYASATEFSAVLERDSRVITKEVENMKLLDKERQWLQHDIILELKEAASILNNVVKKTSVENHVKILEVSAEDLVNRWRIFLAKAKNLYNKILCRTYTTEKIAALNVLRTGLLEDRSSSQLKISAIQTKISDYEQLGDEFKRLVEEIRHLENEITMRQWGLKEGEMSADPLE